MAHTVMLIEGADADTWSALPPDSIIITLPYAQLTLAVLKDHLPDSIVMPLFGPDFDAVDVLARLAQFGFVGPVSITGPKLPNAALIQRELSAAAPGMTVRFLPSG
jgi:hypothetical protein